MAPSCRVDVQELDEVIHSLMCFYHYRLPQLLPLIGQGEFPHLNDLNYFDGNRAKLYGAYY